MPQAELPEGRPAAARPARQTPGERRSDAERRLVEAAAELISEEGPSGLTLAKVGTRAGYSRGLATHHFGSKSALMRRVADTVTESFGAALTADRLPGSLLEDLLHLTRVYVGIVADPPPVNRARLVLIADAVANGTPEVRPAMVHADRVFRAYLRKRIEQAARDSDLREGVDADGLATVLAGMLRGVAFEVMLDPTVDLVRAHGEIEAFLTLRLGLPQ